MLCSVLCKYAGQRQDHAQTPIGPPAIIRRTCEPQHFRFGPCFKRRETSSLTSGSPSPLHHFTSHTHIHSIGSYFFPLNTYVNSASIPSVNTARARSLSLLVIESELSTHFLHNNASTKHSDARRAPGFPLAILQVTNCRRFPVEQEHWV